MAFQTQFYGPVQRWPGTASLQDVLLPSQATFQQQLAASAPIVGLPPPTVAPGSASATLPNPTQVPRIVVLPARPQPRSSLPEIGSAVSSVALLVAIVVLALHWRKST